MIQPEASVRPLYFKEGQVHLRPLGAPMPDPDDAGRRRASTTTCRTGSRGASTWCCICFIKAIATGAMLRRGRALAAEASAGRSSTIAAPAISIVFIALTAVVLVIDLERPERFYYILTRSNWRSWMVWGAYFLTAHGAAQRAAGSRAGWFGRDDALDVLVLAGDRTCRARNVVHGLPVRAGAGARPLAGSVAAIDLIAQSIAAGVGGIAARAVRSATHRLRRRVPMLGSILAWLAGARIS